MFSLALPYIPPIILLVRQFWSVCQTYKLVLFDWLKSRWVTLGEQLILLYSLGIQPVTLVMNNVSLTLTVILDGMTLNKMLKLLKEDKWWVCLKMVQVKINIFRTLRLLINKNQVDPL